MEQEVHRQKLIQILQLAYSGELAAALAYAGHWRSLRKRDQIDAIHQIEMDEWHHRQHLLKMLHSLEAKPTAWRDIVMGCLGCIIFLGCFISGWFFAMYFAGRLEDGNILEYQVAAQHAQALQLNSLVKQLLAFSAKEEEHEVYFYNIVRDHWMLAPMKSVFKWGPQPGEAAKALSTSALEENRF